MQAAEAKDNTKIFPSLLNLILFTNIWSHIRSDTALPYFITSITITNILEGVYEVFSVKYKINSCFNSSGKPCVRLGFFITNISSEKNGWNPFYSTFSIKLRINAGEIFNFSPLEEQGKASGAHQRSKQKA